MKMALLVAHGSRRESSNDEVYALVKRLKKSVGRNFDDIRAAFLELAAPSIPDGIQQCIDDGAREIIVLPYFLSAGRHVVTDVPEEVNSMAERNPNIKIRITPYLGCAPALEDVILSLIE